MHINFISYYYQHDGYGRYSSRVVNALQNLGISVKPATTEHIFMPEWMQQQEGIDWNSLTISLLPPYLTHPIPGKHWVYTMVEGSELKEEWVKNLHRVAPDRIVVPCEHNANVYRSAGLSCPISVIPGGTDPDEFPVLRASPLESRPYTFLTFADRGFRKGWEEVWEAFYLAFGGKTSGDMGVRLIIKCLPQDVPTTISWMMAAEEGDKRVKYVVDKVSNPYDIYAQADCLVLPSRSEGWGMIHREAAMMGIPVITQAYSGMDDGYTKAWALVVEDGKLVPIETSSKTTKGVWRKVDITNLAQVMKWAKSSPETAALFGAKAARWLRRNQTWRHTAEALVELYEHDKASLERTTLQMA